MKVFILILVLIQAVAAMQKDVKELGSVFETYRLSPDDLMLMRHDFVEATMKKIAAQNENVQVAQVGTSVEGRSINMFKFGKGNTKVLLWSQMHGNEPTATAALLAIFNYFSRNPQDPFVQRLEKDLTIQAITMLNPDGAQRFQRRNAMSIDINRDARLLQSPEAQALKKVKDAFKPDFGFNLHNMGGRETVGDTRELLTIALMAPPYDKVKTDNDIRIRAKKLVKIIWDALDPFIGGHIAKYKAGYMPRAFGDAMQHWGVSTVLIESGLHDGDDPHIVEKINFIALLASFDAMSSGAVDKADASFYEKIPLEGPEVFDILIKNAWIFNGKGGKPFRADIGINRDAKVKGSAVVYSGEIEDVGDLDITTGREIISGNNLIVTPGFIVQQDPNDKNGVFSQGITTVLTGSEGQYSKDDPELFIPGLHSKGKFSQSAESISLAQLKQLTVDAAHQAGLSSRGSLVRHAQADLLIFQQERMNALSISNLYKVIKNGRIVFSTKH